MPRLIRCPICEQAKVPHYAKGLCEGCWRNENARDRWARMPKSRKQRRLAQMREYKKRREEA